MGKSISVDQKKRGRGRPATGRDPAASTRLPQDVLEKVDAWAQANEITRSDAIRRLVEVGLAGGSRSIPLLAATRDAAVAAGRAGSSMASEMAGHQIDKLGDASATAEERKTRKQRLLKGPAEFRDIRIDHPATEPARASKPPPGTKAAPGKKTRQRRA